VSNIIVFLLCFYCEVEKEFVFCKESYKLFFKNVSHCNEREREREREREMGT